MKLGIVYHMPFWRAPDGTLREVEGSFARYVDSLAPYFDEIVLCVPLLRAARGEGTALGAPNVKLTPLPHFDGPLQFYPRLPLMLPRLLGFVRHIDLLHCRVPTPAAIFAFVFARLLGRAAVVLVVGDLAALQPTMPYRGAKKRLWEWYTAFEERNVQHMTDRSLAFANGAALARKHSREGHVVVETRTTTIGAGDIATRDDTCAAPTKRILTVSRIDPRKGLRVLPDVVGRLVSAGFDVSLDIVGPAVGSPGVVEQQEIERRARALGVEKSLRFVGPMALERLLPLYREYDLFVLPTLPGEGVPRVLLEAMTGGTPIVATGVGGIPGLITHERNGLLVDAPTADALADALARLIVDFSLRRRLIAAGYATARAHTLEVQAERIMKDVSKHLDVPLRGDRRLAASPVESAIHNPMIRPRLCFVLPSLNGGGAERAAVHVLNALDATRWNRSMYLFERCGPYLDDVDPAIALDAGRSGSRIQRWSALRRYLRAERPDVVVSFLSYFTVLTAARAAGVGSRIVFNQQTPMSAFLRDADYQWRRPWHRRAFGVVTRLGYRLADAIVTSSVGVADDLVKQFGVARERIRVVHNPVNLDAVERSSREPLEPRFAGMWTHPVIVAAGRLADAKNYPLLLDALALLRRSIPARLFILGAGDREAAIRDRAQRLGIDGDVVMCGFQRNPWKYIARADVFALSSRYEGFGNVLVEAMACGVPVVATSSPGTQEIVTVGVDGLLVPHHEPAPLAEALERVLTDRALHERLSEGARRTAERFALPAVAAAYDRVFSEALA